MVGSPNFTRLAYAGDGDHVPAGSKVVEQPLIDDFRTQGLAVDLLEPSEGSDHAGFADAGIPVGGLFTGTDPATSRPATISRTSTQSPSTRWRTPPRMPKAPAPVR